MRKKRVLCVAGALAVTVLLAGTSFRTASADYTNKNYSYEYKYDGEHSSTAWYAKDYNGSNTPHGYVYAYCSYGLDSSVSVRKRQAGASSGVKCTEYVTIPYYTHTNIRNDFNKSSYHDVRLWVRTNSSKENASTFGSWSPDSSRQYSHVVG